jgi:tetratricopeptide (TPR) repeat protein
MKNFGITRLWPLIIFTFALTVRLFFLNSFERNPFFYPDVEGVDPSLYHELATYLAQGLWPGNELLYSHPLYPYLVSILYRFWAPDAYFVALLQFMMGSFSCALLYLIAKRVLGTGPGMISSFIAALYAPFLFYEGLMVPNVLAIFLNLCAIIMLFNIITSPDPVRTFIGGLLMGCSLAANSGIAPFILMVMFWIAWVFRKNKRALAAHLVCLFLAVILPIGILSLKHFSVERRFDSFAAHGGINFYVGNNPDANGTFRAPLGFTPSAKGLSEDSSRYARAVTARPLTALEISNFWYKRAFFYMSAHPLSWLKLILRKFLLFWNSVELGDVADYYISEEYSPLLKFNPFVFGAIAPLGFVGMVLARRHFRQAFLFYAGVFGFMFSCVLFFVNSRYRLSAVPFLIIFAGFAVFKIWRALTEGAYRPSAFAGGRRLAGYAVLTALFFIFSNAKFTAADTVTPLYNLSVIYAKKGMYDESMDISRRLLERRKDLPAAHFNLGVCYYGKNMFEEAIGEFRQTLRFNPDDYNSRFNLGLIYYQKKDYAKALDEFNRALAIDNRDAVLYYSIGRVYEAQDNLRKAQQEYILALQISPDAVQIRKTLENINKRLGSSLKI